MYTIHTNITASLIRASVPCSVAYRTHKIRLVHQIKEKHCLTLITIFRTFFFFLVIYSPPQQLFCLFFLFFLDSVKNSKKVWQKLTTNCLESRYKCIVCCYYCRKNLCLSKKFNYENIQIEFNLANLWNI